MHQPSLVGVVADAAGRAPDAAALQRFVAALTSASVDVSTVEAVRRAASTDFAHLSPILPGLLPERPADAVVFPRTIGELTTTVALAYAHGVPLTPRGKGTGNYGQAVPLAGGMVVDLTRLNRILEVGAGWVCAQAGATFVELEAAARRHGQELAMSPTTVGSTIGGFLAGGAGGVGSIEHGWLWDGFVVSLEVLTCPPDSGPMTIIGPACRPYLHAYGVTGIIATATVELHPARDWIAVLASFPADAASPAADAGLEAMRLDPPPRSVSLDDPPLVALYSADDAMPPGRFSLRCTVDASALDRLHSSIEAHGGRVEAVRPGAAGYLATLAFNHVTLRARQANPNLCHLQVSGDALRLRRDEVLATLPGAMLHLDGLRTHIDPDDPRAGRGFGGLLLSEFRDAATLYAGIARLRQLGVYVVDPHTWLLDGPALPSIRETARHNDPAGLLNPGKLPPI